MCSSDLILVSEHAGDLPIWHIDAYRLPAGSDATRAGILDERQSAGVTLIEWPEHLAGLLLEGDGVLAVHLQVSADGEERIATLSGVGSVLCAALDLEQLRWSDPRIGAADDR